MVDNLIRFFIEFGLGVLLAFVLVALFHPDHPEAPEADTEVVTVEVPMPFPVPGPRVLVPMPFSIADERLGAYRVNGFVTSHGHGPGMSMSRTMQRMACFPVD